MRETHRRETKRAGKRVGRSELRTREKGASGNRDGVPPSNSPLAGVQGSGLTGYSLRSKLWFLKPQGTEVGGEKEHILFCGLQITSFFNPQRKLHEINTMITFVLQDQRG